MSKITDAELADLSSEEIREMKDREVSDRVTEIVRSLMDELNIMGNEEVVAKAFIQEVQQTHRTLQQNFFGHVVVGVIKDFAKRHDEGYWDLRNEASCKTAKKIEPVIKDAYFPFV
jgi:hypothetical protein